MRREIVIVVLSIAVAALCARLLWVELELTATVSRRSDADTALHFCVQALTAVPDAGDGT